MAEAVGPDLAVLVFLEKVGPALLPVGQSVSVIARLRLVVEFLFPVFQVDVVGHVGRVVGPPVVFLDEMVAVFAQRKGDFIHLPSPLAWQKKSVAAVRASVESTEHSAANLSSHYPILGYSIQAEYDRGVGKNKFTTADDLFRELLKDSRISKHLTQADLASRLGQPQSYVSKYETGERRLDFVETVVVCQAIGITIEEFAAAFSTKLRTVQRAKNKSTGAP